MGLDMYLYKRDLRHTKSVGKQCCYWRKANAIHGWFVDNCQGGEDDCGQYPVSGEQLKALLDLCVKVRLYAAGPVGHSVRHSDYAQHAALLLPARCGFFFGSTAYDHWYIFHIDYTISELCTLDFNKSYIYQSSW